jgi:hypothetical protein
LNKRGTIKQRHKQQQRDWNVHCEEMEATQELSQVSALTAVGRGVDQQDR